MFLLERDQSRHDIATNVAGAPWAGQRRGTCATVQASGQCSQTGRAGVPHPPRNLPNSRRNCKNSDGCGTRDAGMSVLRFGAFILDPARGAVLRDGVEVDLRAQSFALLSYLASNPGRLASKDELFDAIWRDAEV